MTRRAPLTQRMADLLERMSFGLDVMVSIASPERDFGKPLSEREALEPSARKMQHEAAALVAEQRRRAGRA